MSKKRLKSNCDVIANFLVLRIFDENRISELRNLLYNNTKFLELSNSRILLSLKVPSYVTSEFYF